ncbi:MAG: amino acid ABC transporter permease [Candidatus Limnocylindria bacterium]
MPGGIILEFPDMFLGGLWLTIQVAFWGLIGSLLLGIVIALMRISPIAPLRWIGVGYVEFFRNTPLLVQLFFFFFGLPFLGIRISEDVFVTIFYEAIMAMSLYHGAYMAEVIRGGLLGVDRGQVEAARSLGLSYVQMLRFVQVPQAVRAVIPPLGNIGIALVKNTSLAATIGLAELLHNTEIVESRTFRAFEAYTAAAMLYLVLTIPLGIGVNFLERRLLVTR